MKHYAPISGVASFGKQWVATAGYDNQLILWNVNEHRPVARVTHDHLANMCVFNSDGDLLASASSDYSARIWEVPSMRLKAVLYGHKDDVEMVAFSPKQDRVATCSRDHTIRIYATNGELVASCVGHQADVISVAWMPNGEELVSSSDDGTVRKWCARSGLEIAKSSFDGVETDTIAITPHGLIFAGDDEGRISVIQGQEVVQTVPAHGAGIKRLVFSAQSAQLISLSYDRKVKLWFVEGNGLKFRAEAELPAIVWPRSCTFVGTDKVAFATFGSTYVLFDVSESTWEEIDYEPSISVNAVQRVNGEVWTVGDAGIVRRDNQYVADMNGLCNFLCAFGGRIITGGQMGTVHDATSGAIIYRHRSPLNCAVAFNRQIEPHFAVGTYTGEIIVLRFGDNAWECVEVMKIHENAIKGLATDGVLIFSVSANRDAGVVAIANLKVQKKWLKVHRQIANGCAVLGHREFCTVSRDLTLRLWRRTGISEIPTPHENSIKCVAAFGGRVASGDYGGRIAVYDLATSHWLNVERPSTSGISSIVPDLWTGGFLASCYDGQVYQVKIHRGSVQTSLALDLPHPEHRRSEDHPGNGEKSTDQAVLDQKYRATRCLHGDLR